MPATKSSGRSSGRAADKGRVARAAREYMAAGIPVIPCINKNPQAFGGFKKQTTDENLLHLFDEVEELGTALTADLVALDLDVPKPDAMPNATDEERRAIVWERYHQLAEEHPEVIEAPLHETTSGGLHIFLRLPKNEKPFSTGVWPLGAETPWGEIRGMAKAMVVLPPSIINGSPYKAARGLLGTPVPEASAGLLDKLRKPRKQREPQKIKLRSGVSATTPYGAAAIEKEAQAVHWAPEGSRNTQLNEAAFSLGQLVTGGEIAGEAEVIEALMNTAVGIEEPEKSRATIRSGLDAGKLEPRKAPPKAERSQEVLWPPTKVVVENDESVPQETQHVLLNAPLTDAGNAERLRAMLQGDYRHVPGLGSFWWTGTHWQIDTQKSIRSRVVETMRTIRRLADAGGLDKADRDALIKHSMRSESRNSIDAAVDLAHSLDGIYLHDEELDTQLDMLPVLNGRIDLKTGLLHPHDRQALDTKVAPVEYQEDAEHWAVDALLDLLAVDGREPLLQEIAGAALSGRTEKKLFFLIGASGTAKSTFADALSTMLGSYAQNVEAATLLDRQYGGGGPRADLVKLRGSRLAVAGELPTTHGKLNPGLLKRITGEDRISARAPHQQKEITFRPGFTLLMHANGRPSFDALDAGMLARVTELPFNTLPPNPKLAVRPALLQEQDAQAALLLWAVMGSVRWYGNGQQSTIPESVQKTTAAYIHEMDPFAEWAEEKLIFEPGAWVNSADLYSDYARWCENNGMRYPKGPTMLVRWLANQPGVQSGDEARRAGRRGVLGVRFKS